MPGDATVAATGKARIAEGVRGSAAVDSGRAVIEAEARALEALGGRIGASFEDAVRRIAAARGRVIVSGIGKSGAIGRKIASTLTSTGTPAFFLHPVESLHGDLGIVGPDDVALILSKSGESVELMEFIAHLVRFGVPVVALTGGARSSLARASAIVLDCAVEEEACPMDLAPTTSTTVTLALGDALAVALLSEKGFGRDDFARIHPGGALGRKLRTRVRDVMETEELPTMPAGGSMADCVVLLARRRGTVAVLDADGLLAGVVTAGDLTRLMDRSADPLATPVAEVMTRTPRVCRADDLGAAAVHEMETRGIMAMPVVDDARRLVGLVHLHDLLRAGAA
ncbi:MAG: KpsF/GutQ family sugar-phosphate isomerase [Gemmatimonadota bacterium]